RFFFRSRASSSPRGESASSMPSPSPNSGGRYSAGSDVASTTPRPTWPSPGSSLTGPPAADSPPTCPPGQPSLSQPQSRTKSLALGDRILLYTDGASEARARGGFFPLQAAAAFALVSADLEAGVGALWGEVQRPGA